jgi:tRNA(Ile)-lysidine synthase
VETPDAERLLDVLEPWRQAPRWWLGLSGGLDSSVLLHLLTAARARHALPPLRALHVDHQLSARASDWRRHCESLCRESSVDLVTRQVRVDSAELGLEAAARQARYAVFEALLGEGEVLLLAHHLDDQVETFFLRLMRGAGTRGLSGMPMSRELGRGQLCRPLLGISRRALEDYARLAGVRWVDDESNRDLTLDRNYLRHRVLPVLAERWPGYRKSVSASITALADAERSLAGLDSATLQSALGSRCGESVLCLDALDASDSAALARLLRRWLEAEGLEPPGRERLGEFARQLAAASADARPSVAGSGYHLRRYRDAVHLCPMRPEPRLSRPCTLAPGQAVTLEGLGTLEAAPVEVGGLRLPASGYWEIRLREGGERCRPAGRARTQSLKKLLQDSAVPPWQRQRLPLLYADGELAAVADLWVCSEHVAPGAAGYAIRWSPD